MDDLAPAERLLSLLSEFEIVDLSQSIEEDMPVFPALSKFYRMTWLSTSHGDPANAYQMLLNEHCGTHVDAPAHYVAPGHEHHKWVDEVPLERWMGRAAIINCRDVAPAQNAEPRSIHDWESANGSLQRDDIVVFDFGWAAKWHKRPDDQDYLHGWPGVGLENAEILIDRGVKVVGVDTFSPDAQQSTGDPFHNRVLPEGICIVECLTNLDRLPPVCYLQILPLRLRGGTGSPGRAIAFVPR